MRGQPAVAIGEGVGGDLKLAFECGRVIGRQLCNRFAVESLHDLYILFSCLIQGMTGRRSMRMQRSRNRDACYLTSTASSTHAVRSASSGTLAK